MVLQVILIVGLQGEIFSMLPEDHSCDIFVKNVVAFYHHPKSLPKPKVKRF